MPAGSSSYEKNFRLRMWIDEDTDFSSGDMNDKTFTITVNVYANAEVVTAEVYNAKNVSYSSEYTECTDVYCALEELNNTIGGE